ncbi:MAG: alpha/beta hydrolase [Promethearchaeota archaeon]
MAPRLKGVITRPEGANAAFLLVHGFCAAPDEMATLGSYLANLGIASFSIQIAGHGTTPENLESTTWKDWYSSVQLGFTEVRSWNSKFVFVAGLSMGGALSMMLAAEEHNIDGLVLLAPALKISGILPKLVPLLKYFWKFRSIDVERAQEIYDVKRTKYEREPLSAYHELFKLQKVVRKKMGNITIPTLILHGTEDKTINPNNGQLTFDGISSSDKKLHLIQGAEHVITCHPTREVAYPIIREFIERLTG